jgi:hypothetical protein
MARVMKRVLVSSWALYLGCWFVGHVLKAEAAGYEVDRISQTESRCAVPAAETPDEDDGAYWSLFAAAGSAQ